MNKVAMAGGNVDQSNTVAQTVNYGGAEVTTEQKEELEPVRRALVKETKKDTPSMDIMLSLLRRMGVIAPAVVISLIAGWLKGFVGE